MRLKKGDVSIGLIGAVLTLGTPQDVTLQELRVEMFNFLNHTQFSGINAGTNLAVPRAGGGFDTGGAIFNNYGSTVITKPTPETAGQVAQPAAVPTTAPDTCNAQNAASSQACYTATQQARPASR